MTNTEPAVSKQRHDTQSKPVSYTQSPVTIHHGTVFLRKNQTQGSTQNVVTSIISSVPEIRADTRKKEINAKLRHHGNKRSVV